MKMCIFCSKTKPTNHNCEKKPAGIFPIKGFNYPETTILPKNSQSLNSPKSIPPSHHFNLEVPSHSKSVSKNNFQSIDLSSDSKILQKVLNFLSLFTPYTKFLNSHNCENFCFVCIAKSYNEERNPNYITMANSSLSDFFQTTPDFIDFSNCLSIVLNLLHTLYLKKQFNTQDHCNSMCISHKIFTFTIYMTISCQCKASIEKIHKPNYFTLNYTVTQESALSKKKNIKYEHPRKIKYCPVNCKVKSSLINSSIKLMEETLMVQVKYEERFSEKVFESFLMFYDGTHYLSLAYFVTGHMMKIFVSDERGKIWNEYMEENRIINIVEYLEQVNDYPYILVYKQSNY